MDYKQIQTERLRHYYLPQLFQLNVQASSEKRGSHGPGVAKDLSSNMSGRVAGQIVPDVSKGRRGFIVRVNQSEGSSHAAR
jgi:hypothetical protein